MLSTELLRAKRDQAPVISQIRFVLTGMLLGPLAAPLSIRLNGDAPNIFGEIIRILLASLAAGAWTSFLCSLMLFLRGEWVGPLRSGPKTIAMVVTGGTAVFIATLLIVFLFPIIGVTTARSTDLLSFAALLATLNSLLILYYEHRRTRRQTFAIRSQLNELEAQIRPHFLFNTLNTVSALIPEQPEKAQQVLNRLAGLFRAALSAPAGEKVALERELDLVRDYLEIEQARFGKRLRFSLPGPEQAAGLSIPPLTLQPLVENAIRHGIANLIEGGSVDVSLKIEANSYTVEISNPTDEAPRIDEAHLLPEGHSLRVVADRLQLIYGGRASLRATVDSRFRMMLTIPRQTRR